MNSKNKPRKPYPSKEKTIKVLFDADNLKYAERQSKARGMTLNDFVLMLIDRDLAESGF